MKIFLRYSISDKILLFGMFCLSTLVFLLFKMVIISLVSKYIFSKNWLSSCSKAFLSCCEKLDNLYLHTIDKLSTIPIKLLY